MFDGLNNNRTHWKELADVYQAKLDAIENEKKKNEGIKGLFKATEILYVLYTYKLFMCVYILVKLRTFL